jgi:hypothetical protein
VEGLQGGSVADGDVRDVHHTALFVPKTIRSSSLKEKFGVVV